jgi:integrase
MIQLASAHLSLARAALALYSGQRMGDALAMRWDHVTGNIITVAQEKTRKRLAIPLHEDLH